MRRVLSQYSSSFTEKWRIYQIYIKRLRYVLKNIKLAKNNN